MIITERDGRMCQKIQGAGRSGPTGHLNRASKIFCTWTGRDNPLLCKLIVEKQIQIKCRKNSSITTNGKKTTKVYDTHKEFYVQMQTEVNVNHNYWPTATKLQYLHCQL